MLPLPTPEEAALIEQAVKFTRTMVMPNAARWERERRYASEALKAAAELGFLRIQVPKALGGLGMRYSTKLRVTEELSRGCMAFAFALVNAHNATQRIARDGTPDQI